jgi:rhamnose transport system ATP-binding protein
MIGRPVKDYHGKTTVQEGQVALQVTGLSRPGLFHDISFTLRKGEILGLGGLVGAGRTDVARALFGIAPAVSGTISVGGRAVAIRDPSDAIAAGPGLCSRGPRSGRGSSARSRWKRTSLPQSRGG